MQRVYFYIDDSGVFCRKNGDFFVFAGYCLTSKEEKDNFLRKYSHVESSTKQRYFLVGELKGYGTSPKIKNKILRSMNSFRKFGVVINLNRVNDNLLNSKFSSQRYKDYALKLAIKHKIGKLIKEGILNVNNPIEIIIKIDQHNIATDGKYGLEESIYEELKNGIFNFRHNLYHPPLFKNEVSVDLQFCESDKTRGIRAADFVANKLFYEFSNDQLNFSHRCHIKILP